MPYPLLAALAPYATAAATAAAAGLGFYGSHRANRASAKSAREANLMSQSSAREQMAFQERMSSTAYQRARQDLIAAKLNPMLAVSQGGAATPGGSSYSGQSSRRDNVFQGLSSAVRDYMSWQAQISNVEAQNLNLLAQANLANNSAKKTAKEADIVGFRGIDEALASSAGIIGKNLGHILITSKTAQKVHKALHERASRLNRESRR